MLSWVREPVVGALALSWMMPFQTVEPKPRM